MGSRERERERKRGAQIGISDGGDRTERQRRVTEIGREGEDRGIG